MAIDKIKYAIYARGESCIILYDKLEGTYAIHSKDEENDVGVITGFTLASDAMKFADKRVKSLDESSKKVW